ncbi:MAG: hypothetical protein PUG76_08100 [Prevotellaceae bacterium]|nr:hypothetical protein [Prevotellaceae bacterium]
MEKRKTSKSLYVRPCTSVQACISADYMLVGSFQGGHQSGNGGGVIGDAFFDGGHQGATGGFVIGNAEGNGGHESGNGGGVLGDPWQ